MNRATQLALRIGAPILVGLVLLGVWWLLVEAKALPRSVPSPAQVGENLVQHFGIVWDGTVVTATNALLGLVIGTVLAVVLAGLAAWLRPIDWMSAPIVLSVSVIPIVALTPILNNLFGLSVQTGRIIVAAIAAFVPVFVNVLRGLRQAKPVQRDLFRAYAASGMQSFRQLTLPTAVPYLVTGIRLAAAASVIAALVAEYFGGPKQGLGVSIAAFASSRVPLAWAHVGAAIGVGLAFFLVTVLIERLVARRFPV